ncbi:MAG: hypothetical protein MK179_12170 [Pirellulaceae bacterium]|nr:hypothetical protein [Pirellulaceae bacterium]
MTVQHSWQRDPGPRLEDSRDLDSGKLLGPCITRVPAGGYRLYYTGVGPAKPFPECQGYILSAFSEDGFTFQPDPGIRVAPPWNGSTGRLRALVPSVTPCADGSWRMYYQLSGPADDPCSIGSANSTDMLHWNIEPGIRLKDTTGVRSPRFVSLPSGGGRLYCTVSMEQDGQHTFGVRSAVTRDGLAFEWEQGWRLSFDGAEDDTMSISAAEVVPPTKHGGSWTMFYSAWQDVPAGTVVPTHPSNNVHAIHDGSSKNFAETSIAVDMAGYRSRIFVTQSVDGLHWEQGECILEGRGYGNHGIDAVHAEDMSLLHLSAKQYRMYYAGCDSQGIWRIASASGTISASS